MPWCSAFYCLRVVALSAVAHAEAMGGEEDSPEALFPEQSILTIPTIVITPEWRPVDAQRTPQTINLIPEAALDRAAVSDTVNLQYLVPGFSFKTNSVLGQPYLRGIGSDIISAGTEPSVATYIDGIYQPRATQSIQELYDLERVEILKGPQGVMLGRNVVGGAISIVTRDPVPYREAWVDVLYGNYNKRQLRGAFNLPLGSKVAFRFAGSTVKRDGYSDNIFLDKELDDEDTTAWRGKLRFTPDHDLDILLSAQQVREDSTRNLAHQPNPNVPGSGGIALGGIVPRNPRKVTHNVDQFQNVKLDLYSVRVVKHFLQAELLSLTAYQKSDLEVALDLDGTNVDFSANFPGETSKSYTQEFRLSSNKDVPLGWIAGLYFLHEDANQFLDVRLPLAQVRNQPDGNVDTNAWAAFGELSRQFKPAWRGTAGVRYSYDERKLNLVQTITDPLGAVGPAGTTILVQREKQSWDAVTPEFALEYTPDNNALYYGKISRGFKSGGFNTTSVQPSFDPEYLWAYELGLKKTWPEYQLRLNSALFYYDFDDMQLLTPPENSPVGTFPIVINAAKSRITGLDLEAWYQPRWNTGFYAGLTLLDAEFDKFVSRDPNNPGDDPDRAGDPLPHAPTLSLNFRADYRWRLERYADLVLAGEYRYQSDTYFNVYKDPAVKQNAFSLVNASLSMESRKGRWYASLYGRNLTDKLYAQGIFRLDPLWGTQQFWGSPRTFGLRVGYRL